MKTKLWIAMVMCCSLLTACSEDDWDPAGKKPEINDGTGDGKEENKDDGYRLMATMTPGKALVGKDWKEINKFMQQYGWDYTEHPNNFSNDHTAGIHIEVVEDGQLEQTVFKLNAHANASALDYERGDMSKDRQRNEMKTMTGNSWNKVNGNKNDWQKLTWKFKLPQGFAPTSDFCHIHQLKAAESESNTKFPIITFTPRCDQNKGNQRMQIIHYGDDNKQNILVDKEISLSSLLGEWIQVECKVHYATKGFYAVKLTRVSDGKVLLDKSFEVDMWRTKAVNVRSKFGIYCSFGRVMADKNDRPTNGIKDESIYLADFQVYEK